jgi:hypothetical protein
MDQIHKQKLYSLIFAAAALIGMFLPWFSLGFFGSVNGFHGWGILSFLGILGVGAACFLGGDKLLPFDETFKKVALGSFGAIILGALIFLIQIEFHAGFGIWLTIIAGVLGLVWVLGKISLPDVKKP